MKNLLSLFAAVALLGSVAAPAVAQSTRVAKIAFRYDAAERPSVTYKRIVHAAETACEIPGVRPLALGVKERACTADLVERAVSRLGDARLAQLHTQEMMRTASAGAAHIGG